MTSNKPENVNSVPFGLAIARDSDKIRNDSAKIPIFCHNMNLQERQEYFKVNICRNQLELPKTSRN